MTLDLFLDHGLHVLHPFLDFSNLRMNLTDQVMLGFREPLDAGGLLSQLFEQTILLGGYRMHPPKTNDPATRANHR